MDEKKPEKGKQSRKPRVANDAICYYSIEKALRHLRDLTA